MRATCVLAVAAGCSFPKQQLASGDAEVSPDSRDANLTDTLAGPSIDARTCFGSGLINVCLTAVPPADLTISNTTSVSTDTGCTQVVTPASGPPLCVIAARTIHVDATWSAEGARPLVIVATDTLEISSGGSIDVSSYYHVVASTIVGQQIGAGEASGTTNCGAPTSGGRDDLNSTATGAGGGAGGSFGGTGGNGARGRDGSGGTAGAAASPVALGTYVRGGCRGTTGGNGDGNSGGAGGHGGGAVYLIAGTSITVAGTISASGQGGHGGAILSGGGGGGSGGFIGLDAPTVTSTGVIFANGGGGGEGGGQSGSGDYGSSGLSATTRAAGGSGNSNGGNGGRGGATTTLDGEAGSTDANGGGAGGGSIGVIKVYPAQSIGGTTSPTPS